MKIVQFGFYDILETALTFLTYTQHSVATGTHDNEVINGWYDNLTQEQRDYTDAYINRRQGEPITRALLAPSLLLWATQLLRLCRISLINLKIAVQTSLTQLVKTGNGVCFQVKSLSTRKNF